MKPLMKYTIAVLMLAFVSFPASADNINKKASADSLSGKSTNEKLYDFFGSDELLEISLQFNIREFVKTKNEMNHDFDARLSVRVSEQDTLSQDIKLRARGKMRRKYCTFPPIMLKIKKSKDQTRVFPKGNMKLVTHCNQGANFENYILKEYLAYKLYSLVTPYSFRTRLVLVNYIDSLRPERTFSEYGILIEDVDDLAERHNAITIKSLRLGQNHMDNYEMARVALFNYMIGNTDWSVAEQHNVKILKINDPLMTKGIPVAYDFDYSGFVNTSYSKPHDKVPITHVTERYFMGSCFSDELMRQVLEEYEELQPQILQTIRDFPYMIKPQRKVAENYINGFYKKFKKEDVLIADINRTCLKPN